MLRRRLIPVLYLQHGWMVRSETFSVHQIIGNPVVHVERMVQWDVDELIVLDISAGEQSDFSHIRADYRDPGAPDLLAFIRKVAQQCRIPLTFGGRINTLEDVRTRIQNGADKITLNAAALQRPDFITEIAREFGSQAVTISIDYRMADDTRSVIARHLAADTGLDPIAWARQALDRGAGEIFFNAIDRDGLACGYDIGFIAEAAEGLSAPVIACGGAGHMRHFLECLEKTGASGVAAGNIFHFTENAYPRAKAFLRTKRDDVR